MNKNKNIAVIIASVLLLLALLDGWPYDYFVVLRFVVTGVSLYVALLAYSSEKFGWTGLFAVLAVLFNPILPVHLTREIWTTIDLVVAILMISSTFALKIDTIKNDVK